MSFPSFCLCRNSLLSFILNDSLAVYEILGWESSFSALGLCDLRAFQLQYCVIAHCVEYVVSYFPHWLKTFSLCLSCLWALFLWCDWVWFSWNTYFLNLIDFFLDVKVIFFLIIFFSYSFCPSPSTFPFRILMIHMLVCLMVSHKPLMLIFSPLLISLLRSELFVLYQCPAYPSYY